MLREEGTQPLAAFFPLFKYYFGGHVTYSVETVKQVTLIDLCTVLFKLFYYEFTSVFYHSFKLYG